MNAVVSPEPGLILGALIAAGWCAALVSFFLTRFLAGAAILPDHPNARSSHRAVTPRAGGIAIFVAWFSAMSVIALLFALSGTSDRLLAFACLVALAFALGAADDYVTLSPVIKLFGEILIAVIFVAVFGAITAIPVPFAADGFLQIGLFGPVLTVFWLVGFMNAFNFMDGVNGLAATAAALVASAMSVAASLAGAVDWAIASVLLAIAICGFAPINLRGRIFMGDNGSLAIGVALAGLAVVMARESAGLVSIFFAPTAFAPFLFDVAFTLVHRAYRRRPLMQAHREHIYQLATRLGRSHVSVTALYLTAIAFSSAVAMAMLSLPRGLQWTAPVALIALMIPIALRVFDAGRKAGLLEADTADTFDALAGDPDEAGHLAQAAE